MIHVIARIKVKPGSLGKFLEIFKNNVPNVLAEDGCISYTTCVDTDTGFTPYDGNTVTVVEEWKSLDHLKAHLQAPHMKQYAEAVKDLRTDTAITVVEPA